MTSSSDNNKSLRLAVIGGGISGLTAAYRLTQILPAAKLVLFEAGDRLGGVLHTRREDEVLMECGADSFIDKLPAAVELCHELGLTDDIIPTNEQFRRALVLHHGKLHPVPEGFVQMRPDSYGPILRSPLLSWRGKLRLLVEHFVPRSSQIEQPDYDESVASFFTRRLGREAFERLVQPLLAGIYTADPYQLSVAATMQPAIEAEKKHGSLHSAVMAQREANGSASRGSGARYASFVTLRNGLRQLIESLTDRLGEATVHLNSQVNSVSPIANQRWSVSLGPGTEPESFDGVIIAVPSPCAGQLLESCDPDLGSLLKKIPYASSAVACLVYHRDQINDPLEGFGIVVPTVEGRQIVAASYSSVKFPGRAPTRQVLIRVFLGGALQPEILNNSDTELLTLAQSEIGDILGIQGEPLREDLVRWNEKMPQYHVGHLQLVDKIDRLVGKHPGLELAGNAYRGVGIPQCVESGNTAAIRLVDGLASG